MPQRNLFIKKAAIFNGSYAFTVYVAVTIGRMCLCLLISCLLHIWPPVPVVSRYPNFFQRLFLTPLLVDSANFDNHQEKKTQIHLIPDLTDCCLYSRSINNQ